MAHSDANADIGHLSQRAQVRAPLAGLHEAERDYGNAVCAVPGVLQYDANMDIMQLAEIASRCVELARFTWKNRPKSDTGSCWEYVPVLVARELGDALASSLGLSREGAELLDQQIIRAAQ